MTIWTPQVPLAPPTQVPEQGPAEGTRQRAHKSQAAEFSGETFHADSAKKTAPNPYLNPRAGTLQSIPRLGAICYIYFHKSFLRESTPEHGTQLKLNR